jgi:rhodanese-related sulfurtransferase
MKRILKHILLLMSIMSAISVACLAKDTYTQISQEEASKMMELDDGHIIVDVRRQDEYDEGHIPGAICIPNESIGCDSPEALPDYDQIILIYCRSGRRSKEAAGKLAGMGYTNIYEFGGILDWMGDIVTDEMKGGIQLSIDGTQVPVTWEENASVDELKTLLPLTVKMSMYGGFEQVGPVGRSIVSNDEQITTEAGDIVLYAGDRIVIFYGSNSWAYTKLGHIDQAQEEMEKLLGQEDVEIQLGWEE